MFVCLCFFFLCSRVFLIFCGPLYLPFLGSITFPLPWQVLVNESGCFFSQRDFSHTGSPASQHVFSRISQPGCHLPPGEPQGAEFMQPDEAGLSQMEIDKRCQMDKNARFKCFGAFTQTKFGSKFEPGWVWAFLPVFRCELGPAQQPAERTLTIWPQPAPFSSRLP